MPLLQKIWLQPPGKAENWRGEEWSGHLFSLEYTHFIGFVWTYGIWISINLKLAFKFSISTLISFPSQGLTQGRDESSNKLSQFPRLLLLFLTNSHIRTQDFMVLFQFLSPNKSSCGSCCCTSAQIYVIHLWQHRQKCIKLFSKYIFLQCNLERRMLILWSTTVSILSP